MEGKPTHLVLRALNKGFGVQGTASGLPEELRVGRRQDRREGCGQKSQECGERSQFDCWRGDQRVQVRQRRNQPRAVWGQDMAEESITAEGVEHK